jgi:hypothetical protein
VNEMDEFKAEGSGGLRHLSVDLNRVKRRTQVRLPDEDEAVTLAAVTPGAF